MADELDELRKATKGLLYPSDTDAPFSIVTDAAIPVGAPASSVDAFFDELKDADDAAKFQKLRQAVYATLTDTKVYRSGTTKVDVYILGKTKSGATAGLHTVSVET